MRYGMCTDIATSTRDRVEYSLLEKIKEAGFDYVEFPLMMIDSLSDEDFNTLLSKLKDLDLACDCSCNYFPGRVKVTGPEADKLTIDTYLEHAMARAKAMGVKKIVFGSNNSRNIPEGESVEQGYDELCRTLNESVVPACRKFGIHVVMEPLRHQSCNLMITLKDGMYVVNRVNKPEVSLLADLMHMMYNQEDADDLNQAYALLDHVHICEMDRMLPENGYCEFLQKALRNLKSLGYDKTISFESKGGDLKKALELLKAQF